MYICIWISIFVHCVSGSLIRRNGDEAISLSLCSTSGHRTGCIDVGFLVFFCTDTGGVGSDSGSDTGNVRNDSVDDSGTSGCSNHECHYINFEMSIIEPIIYFTEAQAIQITTIDFITKECVHK